jgi:hypothetical protein
MAVPVFPVFQLLTDFVCLLAYELCLSIWKIARCSVILFGSVFHNLAASYLKEFLPYFVVLGLGIRVITKLPNTEQSSKWKGITHKPTNRQNQLTTGKLGK